MNSGKESEYSKKETEMEKELRLKIIREEWRHQQRLDKQHEERKSKKIEEWERKRRRALQIKETSKRRYSQRSKSSSPQPRKSIDFERFEDFKTSNYYKDTTIDKKDMHIIKIKINQKPLTKNQSTSTKIEWDINPDDIIFPREEGEGSRPIFEKINLAAQAEKTCTVTCTQNEQSVISRRQLSMDINDDNHKYSADERNRYYRNRHQSRSKSKEEKDRNKKRYRSHSSHSSRYKNSILSIVKDQSSYHRRSKSSSPINKYARERKADNYKNQSSSRSRPLSQLPLRSAFRSSSKNDPDKSCKRNNRVPSECPAQNSPMNFPPYPVYNNYSFPAQSQMFRRQAPPMIWPIGPRFLPIVYPPFPLRMIGWRMPPPRFNNSNRGAHHPR